MKNKLLFLILLLVSLSLFLVSCSSSIEPNQLANCLEEKKVVMYGASWCPHCTEQKELFGPAFENVTYVECTLEKQKCADENIQYLPTWKFPDGTEISRVIPLKELAVLSGCD